MRINLSLHYLDARLTFLGIDDELKNDASSVFSTNLNSSFYPVPVNAVFKVDAGGAAMVAPNLAFTQRNNTKRARLKSYEGKKH